MYSLVSSAKANGAEPFAWLRDLFTRLPYHRGVRPIVHRQTCRQR
ncbi:MAG: transposase domain-containing protein [Planctomycetales bacterium]